VAGEHDVGDVADELVVGQVVAAVAPPGDQRADDAVADGARVTGDEAADVGVELGEPGGRGDVGGGGEPGHLQGQERAGQRGEAGRVGEGQAGEPRDGAGGQGADEPGEQAGGLGVREQLAEELGRVLGDERLHLPEPPGGERGGHRRAEPPVQVAVGPDQRVGPQGTVEVVHRAGFGGQVRREPVPAAGGEAMRLGEHLLDLGVPGDGPPADGRDNPIGDSRRMSARTPKGFSTVALPGPTRADGGVTDLREDLRRYARVFADGLEHAWGRAAATLAMTALDDPAQRRAIATFTDGYARDVAVLLQRAAERGEAVVPCGPAEVADRLVAPLFHRYLFRQLPLHDEFVTSNADRVAAGLQPEGRGAGA
jgi:hypothetical protein